MAKFELRQEPWGQHKGAPLQQALDDGWEPFAVTEVGRGLMPVIWLKRLVSESLTNAPNPP